MNRKWKGALYRTDLVTSTDEGWAAVELHKEDARGTAIAARIVFWDAEGQFTLEALDPELPLEIIEELIAEAKATIRTE
jgi:hypothetical protein